jgi:hypothetical protein
MLCSISKGNCFFNITYMKWNILIDRGGGWKWSDKNQLWVWEIWERKLKSEFEILNADYFKNFLKHIIKILASNFVKVKHLIFAWVCFTKWVLRFIYINQLWWKTRIRLCDGRQGKRGNTEEICISLSIYGILKQRLKAYMTTAISAMLV